MPKCPKCNKEIECLKYYQSGEEYSRFSFVNGDENWEDTEFEPDGKTTDYECPECSEILFHSTEDAINFLKGTDEVQIY
jgi:hypothetical protein